MYNSLFLIVLAIVKLIFLIVLVPIQPILKYALRDIEIRLRLMIVVARAVITKQEIVMVLVVIVVIIHESSYIAERLFILNHALRVPIFYLNHQIVFVVESISMWVMLEIIYQLILSYRRWPLFRWLLHSPLFSIKVDLCRVFHFYFYSFVFFF